MSGVIYPQNGLVEDGLKAPLGLGVETFVPAIAKRAADKGITKAVYDRGGFVYHGRVKALAEGAREGGLEL